MKITREEWYRAGFFLLGTIFAVAVFTIFAEYVPAGTVDVDGYALKHGWYCISG